MTRPLFDTLAAALLLQAPPAAAYVIDGQLDAAYGPVPSLVQTLQTELNMGQIQGDNSLGDFNYANGSELDAVWARVSNDTLHLFVAGNLALVLNFQQNRTIPHILNLFVDTTPGGFNTLIVGAGHPINGFTFDAAFAPEYWFEFYGDGDQNGTTWDAFRGLLPPAGTGALTFLGQTPAGPPGTLVGGTNPFGVRVTIDNRNVAGVTFGCNVSSGADVTHGIEWSIPLTAIGSPEGCFQLAMIVRTQGTTNSAVSNQMLAPLPAGTCALGSAQFVNLGNFAGDQFFQVCPTPLSVPDRAPVSGPSLALQGSNPRRSGEALRFDLLYPETDEVPSLRLHDVRGRVVRDVPLEGGQVTVEVSTRNLAPGVYWARLTHGGQVAARAFVILPR
jgi:hypothetical protein